MRAYLDICCLKRPFDAQDQALVRLEAEAVLTILSLDRSDVVLVRTSAQLLENALNPVRERREAVDVWLRQGPTEPLAESTLARPTGELMALGFKGFDALHIASAEAAAAEVLVTVDERFRKRAIAHVSDLAVRIISPITMLQEVL